MQTPALDSFGGFFKQKKVYLTSSIYCPTLTFHPQLFYTVQILRFHMRELPVWSQKTMASFHSPFLFFSEVTYKDQKRVCLICMGFRPFQPLNGVK